MRRIPRLLVLGPLVVMPLSGAAGRPALNDRCEPLAESPLALDLSARGPRVHLYRDASYAEELAIRYADVTASHHAGNFKTWAIYNDNRESCMARLFDNVARVHSVTLAAVRRAVTDRNVVVDVMLLLTFLFAFTITVQPAVTAITRRFTLDSVMVRVIALIATSFALSLVGWFTVGAGSPSTRCYVSATPT